jgi:hypothetical protein
LVERSRGVRIYGITIIVFGVYSLVGVGTFKQFALMFNPLPATVIFGLYLFTIFYGICGVYCGSKILKLEEWARRIMVALCAASVIMGLLVNRIVMANFKAFLNSGEVEITPDIAGSVYFYTVLFTVLVTLYELSVVYFFTRPNVIGQFKQTTDNRQQTADGVNEE